MRTTIAIAPLLLGSLFVQAQEIQFSAAVNRNEVSVGENFQLTLSLQNAKGSIPIPDLGGLVIVQGPFESSNFSFVNGKMSSSVTKKFTLVATQPGDFTIGAATIKVGGGTISTDPIKIKVNKGSASTGGNAQEQAAQKTNKDLFSTISLSKRSAYVGEQVVASYKLYSRYPNLELANYDLPALNGFWSEDIDLGNTSWEDQLETINGLQYRVAVLKKQVLFPQRPGSLTIAPAELTCVVNRTFFNRGSKLLIKSNAATVDVKAVPGNAPADASGAIGSLIMKVTQDRTEVPANEAVQLKIELSGRCNLKLLDAPKLNVPNDIEVYDPKVSDNIRVSSGGMTGSKTFEYLMIPRYKGEFDLGPISISYFDTDAGAYRTLSSEPIRISVSEGAVGSNAQPGISRPNQREVEVLDKDIRFIKTNDLELHSKGKFLFGTAPYMAGMAAPALAFLLFVGYRKKREKELGDVHGMRRKRASKEARKRLAMAEKALGSQDAQVFYSELSKALKGYLGDKFNMPVSTLDRQRITEQLANAQVEQSTNDKVNAILDECEMARFAPTSNTPKKALLEQASTCIEQIQSKTKG